MKFILEERFILKEETLPPTIDWADEYTKCKTKTDFEHFWHGDAKKTGPLGDGYFKSVWGEKAKQVEKMEIASCLKDYGWTEKENPLIAFLLALKEKPVNKVGLSTITAPDFKVLETAWQKGYLNELDLEIEDSHFIGDFGKYNLIFNPNFYINISNEQEQLELLQIQNEFRNYKKIEDLGLAFANLYSVSGKKDKTQLNNPINPGDLILSAKKVKNFVHSITGKSNKESEEATDTRIDHILTGIDSSKATNFFIGAYDAFRLTNLDGIKTADTMTATAITKLRKNITKGLNGDEQNEVYKKLGIPKTAYAPKLAAQLLIGLAKKTGATFEVKEPT